MVIRESQAYVRSNRCLLLSVKSNECPSNRLFTDHFSGPAGAIGPICVSVLSVYSDNNL